MKTLKSEIVDQLKIKASNKEYLLRKLTKFDLKLSKTIENGKNLFCLISDNGKIVNYDKEKYFTKDMVQYHLMYNNWVMLPANQITKDQLKPFTMFRSNVYEEMCLFPLLRSSPGIYFTGLSYSILYKNHWRYVILDQKSQLDEEICNKINSGEYKVINQYTMVNKIDDICLSAYKNTTDYFDGLVFVNQKILINNLPYIITNDKNNYYPYRIKFDKELYIKTFLGSTGYGIRNIIENMSEQYFTTYKELIDYLIKSCAILIRATCETCKNYNKKLFDLQIDQQLPEDEEECDL